MSCPSTGSERIESSPKHDVNTIKAQVETMSHGRHCQAFLCRWLHNPFKAKNNPAGNRQTTQNLYDAYSTRVERIMRHPRPFSSDLTV